MDSKLKEHFPPSEEVDLSILTNVFRIRQDGDASPSRRMNSGGIKNQLNKNESLVAIVQQLEKTLQTLKGQLNAESN